MAEMLMIFFKNKSGLRCEEAKRQREEGGPRGERGGQGERGGRRAGAEGRQERRVLHVGP